MKKGKKQSKNTNRTNLWIGIIVITLFIAAVMTGVQTDFYPVAAGILIGFLVSNLVNKLD